MSRAVFPALVCLLAAPVLQGCAREEARWTPETVAPPPPSALAIESPVALTARAEPLVAPEVIEGALPLTRDGAIVTGLKNNRFIEVARFGPEIGATYVDESRAVFDPRLLASVSRGRATRQGQGFTTSGSTGNATVVQAKQGGADPVADLLARLQRLNASVNAFGGPSPATYVGNSGSVTLQQYLPTGTTFFLTGAGSTLDNNPAGDESQHSWTVGVSQPLLRGANLEANLADLRQARNTAALSEHEFRGAVIETVRQIERAYWELVLAEEVLAIREFGVTLASDQMKREEELQAVGKALTGDVMSAQAERSAREADLADARAALRQQNIELVRLLSPAPGPRWELSFDPAEEAEVAEILVAPEESERLSMLYRPELAQARLTVANLDLGVVQARNGRLPQLNLVGEVEDASGGQATTSSATDADFDTYRFGLEFETALFNRAERARLRRALLQRDRGESYIGQLEEGIGAEVRGAIVEVERQWARVSATADEVRSRVEAMRVIQGRHEVGKATNLDVLQVQRDLIQAQVNDATARVRYIEALTDLYAVEGTLLERRGVKLEDVAARNEAQKVAADELE